MQAVRALSEDAAAQCAALQGQLAMLQARWEVRKPRPEDLVAIAALQEQLRACSEARAAAEGRLQQLQGEMLLREDNYNRVFRNGGAGSRVLDVGAAASAPCEVVEWMLKAGGSGSGSGGRGGGGQGLRRLTSDNKAGLAGSRAASFKRVQT